MVALVLKRDGLERLRRWSNISTDGELAARIGVDPATVSRILSGKCSPGTKFIAGVMAEFGAESFSEVFGVDAGGRAEVRYGRGNAGSGLPAPR